MTDLRRVTNAAMRSLLGWFGCLDAAAETVNARWGGGSAKGTLSKKASGALDWTVADVIALEDASGQYPVTRMLARRMDGGLLPVPAACLVSAGANIARETGEAVAALLAASASAGAIASAEDRAVAVKELLEARAAIDAALSRLHATLPVGGAE
jgi:hypothetical protein